MRYLGPRVGSFHFASFKSFNQIPRRIACGLIFALALCAAGGVSIARADGQLRLSTRSVDFGRVRVGRTQSATVTIRNSGSTTVTVSGDTVTGSGYTVSGIRVPAKLSAGANFTFTINFSPATAGTFAGTLKLISDASNGTVAVALTGSAYGRTTGSSGSAGTISATPLAAQFGNVPVGAQNTQTIQLANTGSAAVSVSSLKATGTGVSVSGLATPASIAAGGTARFTVAFLPSSAGTMAGTVTVTSTATNSPLTVAVSGTGVTATRLLGVSPTNVAFGNIAVNSTASKAVTLTNSGNSPLTISGDSVTGTGMSASGINGSTTLAPGQSTTLTAAFAPKTTGSVSGSITIASNATNTPNLGLLVTGTGVSTPTSHTVVLQWKASGSSGVSGYYIYRATSAAGPFSRIGNGAVGTTSYTDSSVGSGITYYYAVTAAGPDGLESTYSNQVTAKIP